MDMYRLTGILLVFLFCGCGTLVQPPDLPTAKARVATYMEEGQYEQHVRKALRPAWRTVRDVCEGTDNEIPPAIVLDVDETALSNYPYEKGLNFGHYGPAFYQ